MIRTWHIETAVVAAVVFGAAIARGGGAADMLAAGATVALWGPTSIAARAAELARARNSPTPPCERWAPWHRAVGLALLAGAAALSGSLSGLLGASLALSYRVWRRGYRRWIKPVSA